MNNRGGTNINLPTWTPVNKVLIICLGGLFILRSVLVKTVGVSFDRFLGLSGATFFNGFIYQIATYPFVCRGLMEILFGCLIIWFIGSDLEAGWGRKRYLTFLTVSTLGAAFVYLLVMSIFFGSSSPVWTYPLTGVGGITNALCVAYAILYPNRTFLFMLLFPVKTKYFCVLLIIIQLYTGFMESSNMAGVLAWGHLAAMGFGFLYMVSVSSPTIKRIFSKPKRKKSKANLKIVGSDDDKPPKYWQ